MKRYHNSFEMYNYEEVLDLISKTDENGNMLFPLWYVIRMFAEETFCGKDTVIENNYIDLIELKEDKKLVKTK